MDEHVFVCAVIDVDVVLVERLAVDEFWTCVATEVGRTALIVIFPRMAVTTLNIFLALRDSTSRALGRLPIHRRGAISSMVTALSWLGTGRIDTPPEPQLRKELFLALTWDCGDPYASARKDKRSQSQTNCGAAP